MRFFGEVMNRKSILVAVAFVLILCMPAYADQISNNEKSPESKCDAGGAMDQFRCYSAQLEKLEKKMSAALIEAQHNVKSMWGKEANVELVRKITSSQNAWVKYRDDLCARNYYQKAPVHPPSLSLEIASCKFYKTEERIAEIQNSYLFN
jgi:uncharacterized protein YecT (DUF1311 family)